jgi:hypothetical protein
MFASTKLEASAAAGNHVKKPFIDGPSVFDMEKLKISSGTGYQFHVVGLRSRGSH